MPGGCTTPGRPVPGMGGEAALVTAGVSPPTFWRAEPGIRVGTATAGWWGWGGRPRGLTALQGPGGASLRA